MVGRLATLESLADGSQVSTARGGIAVPALAVAVDANRLDAVLAHRLDPDLVAVRADLVAALGQPAELAEDVAADRVVGVRVDRKLDARVREVAQRDVAAHEPVAVRRAAASTTARGSVSSTISPTISSMMSSTVTMPTVRPYSSTTTASEVRWRCMSASRSSSGLVSGTISASRTSGVDRRLGPLAHESRARLLVWTMPLTRSGLSSSITTSRVWPEATQRAAPPRRCRDVDRHHGRDRRHHLARLLLVQVEDAVEHLRLARVELPAGCAARDQHAQLLGGRAASMSPSISIRRMRVTTKLAALLSAQITGMEADAGTTRADAPRTAAPSRPG